MSSKPPMINLGTWLPRCLTVATLAFSSLGTQALASTTSAGTASAATASAATASAATTTTTADAAAGDIASRAQQAFDSGDFEAAARDYDQLVKSGIVNGQLFYNLGVAYYRSGHLGDAVAAFLGARRYLPRDPDTDANLRFVLGQIHDKLEPTLPRETIQRVMFWLDRTTEQELAWAAALLAAVWGVLMTTVALVPALNRWRLALAPWLLVPLLLLLSLALKTSLPETWAAVNQPEAKVYSGPGVRNTQLFALQEGAPVLITERAAGGFYRIKLSDGKQGWVSDSQIRLFGPL